MNRFAIALMVLTMAYCSQTVEHYPKDAAQDPMLRMTSAGLIADGGKLLFIFGGDFSAPVSRFTVTDVSNRKEPRILLDNKTAFTPGHRDFLAESSADDLKWLNSPGNTEMDFDVTVYDGQGNAHTLKQGAAFSEAVKKQMSALMDDQIRARAPKRF